VISPVRQSYDHFVWSPESVREKKKRGKKEKKRKKGEEKGRGKGKMAPAAKSERRRTAVRLALPVNLGAAVSGRDLWGRSKKKREKKGKKKKGRGIKESSGAEPAAAVLDHRRGN